MRWLDTNDVGNDHGLAIDDLTVSAQGTTAVTLGSLSASPLGALAAVPALLAALGAGGRTAVPLNVGTSRQSLVRLALRTTAGCVSQVIARSVAI